MASIVVPGHTCPRAAWGTTDRLTVSRTFPVLPRASLPVVFEAWVEAPDRNTALLPADAKGRGAGCHAVESLQPSQVMESDFGFTNDPDGSAIVSSAEHTFFSGAWPPLLIED